MSIDLFPEWISCLFETILDSGCDSCQGIGACRNGIANCKLQNENCKLVREDRFGQSDTDRTAAVERREMSRSRVGLLAGPERGFANLSFCNLQFAFCNLLFSLAFCNSPPNLWTYCFCLD